MNIAPQLPVETSVLLRGKHGIGKSQVVRQLALKIAAKEGLQELPVVDRRLSQMSEGDMVGLPIVDGDSTKFLPPDWYLRACREPVCLFLDELNRASIEVMQCAFQIVLDRTMNGHTLHPQTRVFSAVNSSAEYTVNEIDPALLDRFWCVDLDPDVQDWLEWARTTGIHSNVIDFISKEEKWLDPPANVDSKEVHPSRRSWERVNRALVQSNAIDAPDNNVFYPICTGFLGTEATIAFHAFVKTIDNQVSGEEIVNDYKRIKPKIEKLGTEKLNICIDKMADYCIAHVEEVNKKQGANLKAFFEHLPGELRISAWCKLTAKQVEKLKLAASAHPYVMDSILDVFGVKKGDKNAKAVIPDFILKQQEEARLAAEAK